MKSNKLSILLAFQTLSSRQLNNRGFPLVILNEIIYYYNLFHRKIEVPALLFTSRDFLN